MLPLLLWRICTLWYLFCCRTFAKHKFHWCDVFHSFSLWPCLIIYHYNIENKFWQAQVWCALNTCCYEAHTIIIELSIEDNKKGLAQAVNFNIHINFCVLWPQFSNENSLEEKQWYLSNYFLWLVFHSHFAKK